MFWSNAYTRFLEEEVKRLQSENRILLSAILERSGYKAAANDLRGEISSPQPNVEATEAEVNHIGTPVGRSWRQVAMSMSNASKPKTYQSSADALEAKVKEHTQ